MRALLYYAIFESIFLGYNFRKCLKLYPKYMHKTRITRFLQFFDHYVKHKHENLRMQGYHDFHRAMNVHKGIPLYIVTLWNTTIMAIQALMQHYYGDHFAEQCIEHFLTPTVYITLFSIAETIVLSLVNGNYIGKLIFV